MGLQSFSIVQTEDTILNRVQTNIQTSLNPITQKIILDGSLITGIILVSGTPLAINHLLGQPVRDWLVMRLNANAVIWETPSANPDTTLILNASANCTINLWVM